MMLFQLVEKDPRVKVDPEDLKQHGFKTAHVVQRDQIVHISFGKKGIGLHRLILGDKEGCVVDHKDRNGLNNSRENLRHATEQQNSRNMTRHFDGKGKYKGVSWHSQRNCWRAYIWNGTKQISLGLYVTAELAAEAYNTAAKKLFGEFACLNEV